MTEDVKGDNPITVPEPTGASATQTPNEDVEKLTRAFDKSRTEFHKKLEAAQKEIEDLRKSTMSEAQLRKLKEEQLEVKEKELSKKELLLVATDALKESGIPLEAREFVIADTPDLTRDRVLKFQAMFQKAVEDRVEQKFKSAGHEPGKAQTPATATFTRDQIKAMTQEERIAKLPELKEAMAKGLIK